jgi:uncharacterized protein with PIN domain
MCPPRTTVILYVLHQRALVKLCVEPEGGAVQQLVESAEIAAISLVAYAEARAALAHKRRERAVDLKDYRRIIKDLTTTGTTISSSISRSRCLPCRSAGSKGSRHAANVPGNDGRA